MFTVKKHLRRDGSSMPTQDHFREVNNSVCGRQLCGVTGGEMSEEWLDRRPNISRLSLNELIRIDDVA